MANDEPVFISCSLKRKRPPMIQIPNVLREISTDFFNEKSVDAPLWFADKGVGVFSLKGKKKFMEDSYKIFASSNGNKRFFGVYDGHGGSKAAEFVTENLHLKIIEMLDTSFENHAKEEACKAGFLKTDEEFLKQGLGSGACCVTALIEGKEMVVSNLGDCRAVVCRDGSAEALTMDHRPACEDERRRIEGKGGFVEMHRGTWRVQGTLAVSRSIGDGHLKEWVMAEPDTKVVHLTPDMQFLLLASDGLWDEVSNQEAVDIVLQACSGGAKQYLSKLPTVSMVKPKRRIFRKVSFQRNECENESPPSKSGRASTPNQTKIKTCFQSKENEFMEKHSGLLAGCKKLADLAVSRGSLDDVTVMIVDLSYYNG